MTHARPENACHRGFPIQQSRCETGNTAYWTFSDEQVMINGVAMKGRQIIILTDLQPNVLEQLHSNNMGIERAKPANTRLTILGIYEC